MISLPGALVRMQGAERNVLMVVERETLVRMLTMENLTERLALEAAGRQPPMPDETAP